MEIRIPDGNPFTIRLTARNLITGEYTEAADLGIINNLVINYVRRGVRFPQSHTIDGEDETALVTNQGTLDCGIYGIELTGFYAGYPFRFYGKDLFEVTNETDDITDFSQPIDIEILVKLVSSGVSKEYVDYSIRQNAAELETVLIRGLEHAGKVDDVKINGTSIVDANKVANIDASQFGHVDDVTVNGQSVVSQKVAAITIPTKVSDLQNDAEFISETDAQALVDEAKVNEASVSYTEDGGEPDADVELQNNQLNFQLRNMKMKFSDLTPEEKLAITGPKGPQGDSAVYNPDDPDTPDFEMASTTGQSTTKAMTQKAVTDALEENLVNIGTKVWESQNYTQKIAKCYCRNYSDYAAYQTINGSHSIFFYAVTAGEKWKIRCGAAAENNHIDYALVSAIPETITTGTRISPYVARSGNTDIEVTIASNGYIMLSTSGTAPVMKKFVVKTVNSIAEGIADSKIEPVAARVTANEANIATLEGRVDNIVRKTTYNYVSGDRYSGNAAGATVEKTTNKPNIAGAKVPCQPGDKFMLNGTGFDAYRLLVFADENNVVISVSPANRTVVDGINTAPENAAWLYSTIDPRETYKSIVKVEGDIELRMIAAEKNISSVTAKVNTISEKTAISLDTNKRIGGGSIGGELTEYSGSAYTNYLAKKVACQEGDTFLYTGTGADAYRLYYWLDEDEYVIDNAGANLKVKDRLLVAPPNAAWLVVNCTPSSDPHSLSKIGGLEKMIWENNPSSDSVKVLYDNAKHLEMISAVKFSAPSATESRGTPLTLLHFSDLHDNRNEFDRIIKYYSIYGSLFDDILNTGDTVLSVFGSVFFLKEKYAYREISKKILNVIGNHDTRATDSSDWYTNAGINAYNQQIAPSVEYWGVTQPEDASTEGKCYYYKDYTTQGIRMIVLDDMVMAGSNYDASQITWFEEVLADAKENNLSVLGVKHSSANVTPLENAGAWHERNATVLAGADAFYNAVDAFIEGGGKFICWLTGHTHYNVLGTVTNHTNQLNLAVGSGYDDNYQYSTRAGAAVDCFNVIAIDTTQKTIKVMRVGNNIDWKMRECNLLCVDYNTRTIISES